MPGKTLEQQVAEAEEKERKHYRRMAVIIPIVTFLMAVAVWFAAGVIRIRHAEERMAARISRAHSFATIVHEWTDRGKEIESGIYRVNDTDGDFNKFLLYYFSDAKDDWFGLALDEDGNIRYTLYSEREIPEEYLQNPPDQDEQYAVLKSHFLFKSKKTVAVWEPESDSGTEEP